MNIWKKFISMESSGDYITITVLMLLIVFAQLKAEGYLKLMKIRCLLILVYHLSLIRYKLELLQEFRVQYLYSVHRFRRRLKRKTRRKLYREKQIQLKAATKYHNNLAA